MTALKARFDLVPPRGLEQVALLLAAAAEKHGERGWEQDASRDVRGEIAAALRHVFRWLAGTTIDPEYGYSHLVHAAARLLIAVELLTVNKREI